MKTTVNEHPEAWMDIQGYEGKYQVSNKGNIKSSKSGKERLLKPYISYEGYALVTLSSPGTKKLYLVHRLVAQAFFPNFFNCQQVNHIDGNKLNNLSDNLEWVTHSYNVWHSRHVLNKGGRKRREVAQYTKDGQLIRIFDSISDAARRLRTSPGNICACCNNLVHSSAGYHWRYA